MPGKGYATLGLKPSTFSLLTSITDAFYPGMFLPSTLIILMNEVKLGRYAVNMHPQRLDLTGRYNTITIRSDIKEWMDENYGLQKSEYEERYKAKCYSHFVGYFLANLFDSKHASQDSVIRLHESDFEWLRSEYDKHKKDVIKSGGKEDVSSIAQYANEDHCSCHPTFDRFADMYVNDMLRKMRTAREILAARL